MKTKFIKRMMTGALAVALVMAPSLSVCASTTNNTVESESTVEAIVVSESSGEVSTVEEIPTTSTVAGVKSTTAGVYLATNVNGSVITSSVASIKAGYGLAANETPYAKFSNFDPKKSNLANQSLVWAAASQKAEIGPKLNIELGKMSRGKYNLLSADGADIQIMLGIPRSFQKTGVTFALACVRAGGAVTIIEDLDDNPATFTGNIKGGAGAYALIRY